MRRQTHDTPPLLGPQEVESEHRAGVDLAWIVVASVSAVAAAIWLNAPDRLVGWINRSGSLNFNGLLALMIVAPLGATVFATRRYRDAVGAQRELARLSDHDALTGLPNRRNLWRTLPMAMTAARKVNSRSGVMFVDLNGFKLVNDTYGHEVGDRLMVHVGRRLRDLCGESRWVSRFGGDEFVILDPTPTTEDSCFRFAQQVVSELSRSFELGQDRISISASVGISFGSVGDDPEQVVKDADLAMYEAKESGDQVTLFSNVMRTSLTPATAGIRLERAITAGEFRLMYQPMVLLDSGTVVGVEALLRWDDPERGLIDPVDFLPALEATGLIVPVGRWVMNEVCRQARRWADQMPDGRPPLRVSMNVSPRELAQSDFVTGLGSAIDLAGTNPRCIYLEANETALTADSRKAWTALTGARKLGVGLAADNFGRGFTSLAHLRHFEFDLLKLDGPFASGILDDGPGGAVVRKVIELAAEMGIAVLAEGLADEATLAKLGSAGCVLGQGYLISEPLDATTIDEVIARGLAGLPDQAPMSPIRQGPKAKRATAALGTVVLPSLRRARTVSEPAVR